MAKVKSIKKAVLANAEKYQQLQAEAYAVGAVLAGAKAAPGPGDTKYATGRSRMALTASNNKPSTYDPGVLGSYKIPDKKDALFHVKGRKPGDSVVINQGVRYTVTVQKYHKVIKHAHEGGLAALQREQAANARKASS